MSFNDYVKAFDRVHHESIMAYLITVDINEQDKRFIANVYWNQKASVRLADGESDEFDIKNE